MILERFLLNYKIHQVKGKENIPKETFIILFRNSGYFANLSYLEKFTHKIHIFVNIDIYTKYKKYCNKKEHIPFSSQIKRKAFDLARLYLKNNHIVAIPINKETNEVAKLALRSKHPILPITLTKNKIIIKEPIYPKIPKKITNKKIKELELILQ